MTFTYHQLKAKTVAELREIAKGIQHEAVQGYTQLNKEHLLLALCKALDIPTHEHHSVGGIDKAAVKATMRTLRAERATAIAAGDHEKLKAVRRHLHALNHDIRRHTMAD
jgi:DNA-binding IclR family transcriptional regulator